MNNWIEELKTLDVEKISFSNDPRDYQAKSEIKQASKSYIYIRVALYDEIDLAVGEEFTITYLGNQTLDAVFVCYNKVGQTKDADGTVNYNPDDDKKTLVLMVDQDKLNKDSDNIPDLRCFFRASRYHREIVYRKSDLVFLDSQGNSLNYYWLDI